MAWSVHLSNENVGLNVSPFTMTDAQPRVMPLEQVQIGMERGSVRQRGDERRQLPLRKRRKKRGAHQALAPQLSKDRLVHLLGYQHKLRVGPNAEYFYAQLDAADLW